MKEYFWDIDEKQELMDLAKIHFYDNNDFYDSISADKNNVEAFLSDEFEKGIPLDIASKLVGIVNDSEPIYDLGGALEHPNVERKNQGSEEFVQMDPSYQDFVFKGYTSDELRKITGEDKQSLENYVSENEPIPEQVYLDVFEDLKSKFSENIDFEGDLYLISVEEDDSKVMDDVSASELIEIDSRLKKLRNFKRNKPQTFGILANNFELIMDDLVENLEKDIETYKTSDKSKGKAANALDSFGYFGGPWAKTHQIVCRPEELHIIENELIREEEELVQILKDIYEEDTNLEKRISNDSKLPSEKKYKGVFEGLANAKWRAGLDNEYGADRDILVDQILEKTYEANKVPKAFKFYDMEDTFGEETVQRIFDENGFKELVREAGLESRRTFENSVDKGDKFYVEENEE